MSFGVRVRMSVGSGLVLGLEGGRGSVVRVAAHYAEGLEFETHHWKNSMRLDKKNSSQPKTK